MNATDYYTNDTHVTVRDVFEESRLVTVRDMETGRCFGIFKDPESALLAIAKSGLQNWVAEQRHPTLAEMHEVLATSRCSSTKWGKRSR